MSVCLQTCACYYPVQAGSQTHGPFTVETRALDTTFTDITIRDMAVVSNKKVTCVLYGLSHSYGVVVSFDSLRAAVDG